MARWKLTEKHYLNVPGTKWEHIQIDRRTGKQVRKTFNVPLFLDPEADDDCNYNDGFDKQIIVCHEGKGQDRDIVFVGDPTPGMLPIDDEAKAITSKFDWTPTQGLDDASKENSYTQKLLLGLVDQMSEAQSRATQSQSTIGIEKLLETMAAMMAQQTEILARLSTPPAAPNYGLPSHMEVEPEPIIDEEPPLEDVEPTAEEIEESARAAAAKDAASIAKATAHASRRRV